MSSAPIDVSTVPPDETATVPPPARALDSIPPADSDLPPPMLDDAERRQVGRCELFAEIGSGGMATVHLGRWVGAGGFVKTVAVKALHRQFARDKAFVDMFLDEARVVARIRHPNVMPTIDLVDEGGELFIVMDYVEGVTLAHLLKRVRQTNVSMPVPVVIRIMIDVLNGLHAAHEAKDARGEPMEVIHRDVSPDNILVGSDGYPRLIDFGIARAMGRLTTTRAGEVKGKLSYMTPEQVLELPLTRRSDVFSASLVAWQALVGRKLFRGKTIAAVAHNLIEAEIIAPSDARAGLPKTFDSIILKGLERESNDRWPSAQSMAQALEKTRIAATHGEVASWVRDVARKKLRATRDLVKAVESAPLADTSEEELNKPLSVFPAAMGPGGGSAQAADVPPAAALPAEVSDPGFVPPAPRLPSEALPASPRSSRAPLVTVAVVALVLAVLVVVLLVAGGDSGSESAAPTPSTTASLPSTAAATVETAAPEATAAPPTTAAPSASAAPEPSATAAPQTSASGTASPPTGPMPKWRPPSGGGKRLPRGI